MTAFKIVIRNLLFLKNNELGPRDFQCLTFFYNNAFPVVIKQQVRVETIQNAMKKNINKERPASVAFCLLCGNSEKSLRLI